MRTRTYLILWIALAISVVLVVVLSSCSSDEEALPTSVDSTSTPVPSGFSTDVLRSPEFKDCIEELVVFAGHRHVYDDKTVKRDVAHQHQVEPSTIPFRSPKTDYSKNLYDETDTVRTTNRGGAILPFDKAQPDRGGRNLMYFDSNESLFWGCNEILSMDSAP